MSVACRHLTIDVYKCKDTLFLQSDKEKTVERSYFHLFLIEQFLIGK